MRRNKKPSAVEEMYNKYFNRVPVSIMKLTEISNKIKQIIAEGGDQIDAKMTALVAEYREAPTI